MIAELRGKLLSITSERARTLQDRGEATASRGPITLSAKVHQRRWQPGWRYIVRRCRSGPDDAQQEENVRPLTVILPHRATVFRYHGHASGEADSATPTDGRYRFSLQ